MTDEPPDQMPVHRHIWSTPKHPPIFDDETGRFVLNYRLLVSFCLQCPATHTVETVVGEAAS